MLRCASRTAVHVLRRAVPLSKQSAQRHTAACLRCCFSSTLCQSRWRCAVPIMLVLSTRPRPTCICLMYSTPCMSNAALSIRSLWGMSSLSAPKPYSTEEQLSGRHLTLLAQSAPAHLCRLWPRSHAVPSMVPAAQCLDAALTVSLDMMERPAFRRVLIPKAHADLIDVVTAPLFCENVRG